MELLYNVPIEVTRTNYNIIMGRYPGVCAGREENGKCYVMLWLTSYRNEIKQFLN